ncbi:MAG: choice-of-anchor D domain-containing protein [Deltaproteobacteria bacterium]|nr:choice-of-anchor D domain-containing protein [Deltaproteobacteria bacterium]
MTMRMTTITRALLLGSLASLAAGCGDGDRTVVALTIQRGDVAGPVHRIELEFALAGRPAAVTLREPDQRAITLPTSTTVELGPDSSGALYIAGTAIDGSGAIVGHGSVVIDARPGDTGRATLEFGIEAPRPVDGGLGDAGDDAGGGPVARLVLEPASRDLGEVVVGQRSSAATFTLENQGDAPSSPLGLSVVGAAAPAFELTGGDCAGVALAPAQRCSITLEFVPAAPGGSSAELLVQAGAAATLRAPLDGTGVPVGALRITPSPHDFGALVLGTASPVASFTVTMQGPGASGLLTTQLGGSDSTQFAVVSDGCVGNQLAAGASCVVTARFAPTSARAHSASLSVRGSPGGAAVAALAGVATEPPRLTLSPPSADLGSVVLPGTGAVQLFTVSNGGGVAAPVLSALLAGSDQGHFMLSSDGCTGVALAAGASCSVGVQFRPTTRGVKVAALRLSAAGQPVLMATLGATAQAPAALRAQPGAVSFGDVVIPNLTSASVTIDNPGDVATGSLAATLTGGAATQHSLLTDGCSGQQLGPGASCMMTLRFAPVRTGLDSASLAVTGAGATLTVAIEGSGLAQGALVASPAAGLGFADTLVGQSSATQTITLSNSGGTSTGALTTRIVNGDVGAFTMVANSCVNASLMPAGTCVVTLRFAPASAGNAAAQLEVAGSPGGVVTAPLAGRGLAPAVLAISPASRDFGVVIVGAPGPSQVFTVSNGGDVASGVPGATLTGSHAADYQVSASTCMAALAPGASCALTVRFTPSAGSVRDATLTATASPGGSAQASLTGTGNTPATLTLSPGALAFGTRLVGSDTTLDVTVSNGGQQTSGALGLPSSSDGAQFAIVAPSGGQPCAGVTTLAGGASCRFGVRFHPVGSGARSASISIGASPGGNPGLTATGTGQTAATLELLPAAFGFGALEVGTSATQPFTLSNRGEQAAGALTGPASSDAAFTIEAPASGPSCVGLTTLAGGASCAFVVRFMPPAVATRSGAISVTATPGGGASAAVTGSGQSGAALTASPSNLSLGDVDVGSASAVGDITLSNTGSLPTGALTMPTPAPATFTVVAPTTGTPCSWGAPLAGGASCRFGVRFSPTTTGSAVGTLAVTATPGGGPSVALSGVGQTPPALEVSPAAVDLGVRYLGSTTTQLLTVRNTGTRTSGALTLAVTGAGFTLAPVAGDCGSGQTLAGGASCTTHVQFMSATRVIDAMGNLSASIPGASDSATLLADAIAPGRLSAVETTLSWGVIQVGAGSPSKQLTVRNDGDEPVTGLAAVAMPEGEFKPAPGGTCTQQLAAGAQCTQLYVVTPAAGGARSAVLQLGGTSAGAGNVSTSASASAVGGYLVSISRAPAQSPSYVDLLSNFGNGSCTSPSCSYLMAGGDNIILAVHEVGGATLSTWLSGPCAGSAALSCSFLLAGDVSATVVFR